MTQAHDPQRIEPQVQRYILRQRYFKAGRLMPISRRNGQKPHLCGMRVVILSESFTEQMGYSDTLLAKTLAALGVEVHIVTSDQYLTDYRGFRSLYAGFLAPVKPMETREAMGCIIHTLPARSYVGKEGVYLVGLKALLHTIKPDIVQAVKLNTQCTWQARWLQRELGFKLFLEEHNHWSVFQLHAAWKRRVYQLVYGSFVGRWFSKGLEKDYCLGNDCREIAVKYYGIPASKAVLTTHGTDTDIFRPAGTAEAGAKSEAIRAEIGVELSDILCIYTGRINPDKQPLLLAQAVEQLRAEGLPYRALFVGWGPDGYRQHVAACAGSSIQPFVKWYELADFYRAANIAVWPAQESLSQLDAIASGLPLVLHDAVGTPDRADGNGRLFRSGDVADLMRVLRELEDANLRSTLGIAGRHKAEAQYSWRKLAQARILDYESALAK